MNVAAVSITKEEATVSRLPFATKDGYWNGDMLHDWLEGDRPTRVEDKKLWTAFYAYQKQAFEEGVAEGVRRQKMRGVHTR